MRQWWGSPSSAEHALGLVDDSDVAMGVATAVLGYHGLASQALPALGGGRLMDGVRLGEALDKVDLEPVCKAIAAATRPVMGDAAEAYGRVYVRDLHQRACESTQQVLASLVGQGVPWPTAIERAVLVHGVPADRLGPVSKYLRDPKASFPVLADASDRALLEFAKACGELEASDAVSKAVKFREQDVRRDSRGRFADEPDKARSLGLKERRVDPAAEERRLRRQRRLRNLQRQQSALQAAQPKARQAAPAPKGTLRATVEQAKPKVQAATHSLADQLRRFGGVAAAPEVVEEVGVDETAGGATLFEALTAEVEVEPGSFRIADDFVAFISNEELVELGRIARVAAESGQDLEEMTVAGFRDVFNRDLSFTTMANLGNALGHAHTDGLPAGDQHSEFGGGVWLRVDQLGLKPGTDPDNEMSGAGIVPNDGARFDVRDLVGLAFEREEEGDSAFSSFAYQESQDEAPYEYLSPAYLPWHDKNIGYPRALMFVDSKLDNDTDFSHITSKAYQFREQDVKRDAQGRFADEGKIAPPKQMSEMEARRQRRMRRMGRLQRQQAQIQQAQQAPRQEVKAPRGVLRPVQAAAPQRQTGKVRSLAEQMRALGQYQQQQKADGVASPLADAYSLRFGASEFDLVGILTSMIDGNMADYGSEDYQYAVDALKEKVIGTAAGDILRMADSAMVGTNRVVTDRVIRFDDGKETQLSERSKFYSREDAIEAADALAARHNTLAQQTRRYSGSYMPFIDQVADGVYTANAFRETGEHIGTQIVFGDDAMEAVSAAIASGDWSALRMSQDESVGSHQMILDTAANADPAEYPEAEVRVITLSLRNNA